jgi:hypothetical protein
MGDRVLIQVINGKAFSPVAYGHWCGHRTPEIIKPLKERMQGREGDVIYTFARLVQEMTNGDPGNLSFGCWNATKPLGGGDSHGDAGVVLIDLTGDKFICRCLEGYLKPTDDGLCAVGD